MANLASVIMEGANFSTSSVDLGDYDYSGKILAESSFLNSATATLFTDIMEAEQEYMVADVIGAATIIRENSMGNAINPVVVTENIIKGGLAKIKAAFQKFFAKIKEFYKKVTDWFKAMTSNAEDFVKNFGDKVKEKAKKAKYFKYTGYKYTISAGDAKCDDILKNVEKKITETSMVYDQLDHIKDDAKFDDAIKDALKQEWKEDGKKSATEVVDDYLSKELKFDDIAEMKKEIVEAFQDGDESTHEIENFEDNSVDSMLSYLKDSKSKISKFESQLKKHEDQIKRIIKKLNNVEAKETNSINENMVSQATYISSIISSLLNVYKAPCEVQIAMHKEISKTWLGVLKKFYNYRGKELKESATVFDAESYAMLENSLILEGVDDSDDDDSKDFKDTEECTESVVASILEQASRFTM